MSAAGIRTPPPPAEARSSVWRALVLARLACAGEATRAGLIRDLAPLVAHVASASEWRDRADAELMALEREGYACETKGRLAATPGCRAAADAALGSDWPSVLAWPEQRDIRLTAKALGVETETRATLAALAKPDGLKIVILQKAFGLPVKGSQSIPKLRDDLAAVALARAFGNKIKTGLEESGGLPAKAARLLAGHLSKAPRDFGSDGRLVSALAAEQAGSDGADGDSLRLAVLRAFVSRGLGAKHAPETGQIPEAANDRAPALPQHSLPDSLPARPDLAGFVSEVQTAARSRADGWPKKAYISHVWEEVRASAPHWALSEIEFKCMLAEAHRAGRVTLATADLKDARHIADLEKSAIAYKNTTWHFVRVED